MGTVGGMGCQVPMGKHGMSPALCHHCVAVWGAANTVLSPCHVPRPAELGPEGGMWVHELVGCSVLTDCHGCTQHRSRDAGLINEALMEKM